MSKRIPIFVVIFLMLWAAQGYATAPTVRHVAQLPPGISQEDFIGVNETEHYKALHLREGESAQEFFFDDLMGLDAERVEGGYRFNNNILDIRDTALDNQLLAWADRVGARSYLIDDGAGGLLVFRNAFRSNKPGDPVIGASAFYTNDDTNLCGYVAVAYLYNGLTGDVTLSPMEAILTQTTLPAGRGLTTFFPALPPLSLHLGGITPRDLSIVASEVLRGTQYTTQRIPGAISDVEIESFLQTNLGAGLPVIAFVNIIYEGTSDGFRADASGVLDPNGTYGHFVVVTGFSEQDGTTYYRIRNPYDNQVEYYTADDFLASVFRTDDAEFGASLILVRPAEVSNEGV